MAPSLQDLIDFLLAEIALCGDQGASLSDVLAFTSTFYAQAAQDTSQKSHTIDRRFQTKVWSWLTRHPEVSVGKGREANHLSFDDVERRSSTDGDQKESTPDAPNSIRIFVSEERTWLAITGHEPDETKVYPTEFHLLSIIASGRSNGIPQTDLVRLSGQDKRSVPKRTDRLQTNGYIQKRAIQLKAVRTSLCTLRRFLKPEYLASQAPTDRPTDQENRVIDFNAFTDKLFEILKEYKVIARDDLKKLLCFSDAWHWKALSRALRKFERIGVLKRVKAPSQYKDTMKKFHPCVMLLREPSERDLQLFHEFSRSMFSNLEHKEEGEEPDENFEEDAAANEDTVGMVKREENIEEAGRILPTWTPDRNLHHLLFDTIDAAGSSGINNFGVVRTCFGGFFRRPLENALIRLVECWQLSQPPHLRHLAIVRDTILHRTQAMYIYYSARNFKELVEAGEAAWEAVEFAPKRSSSNNVRVAPVGTVPQVDEYGFPLAGASKELLKNGNATLLECIAVCKPADYTRSSSDPVAIQLEDGSYSFRTGNRKLPSNLQSNGPRKPKELKDETQGNMGDDHDNAQITQIKRPKKSKRDEDRFRGMSQKEKLEAMGMDETWTEYSIHLIQRQGPGVYVTPRGRRRPVGKSRGRPRTSQFAVFKSAKLASLPWFTKESDDTEEENAANGVSMSEGPERVHSTETPAFAPTPSGPDIADSGVPTTPSRGAKRSFQQRESSQEESAPAAAGASRPRRGRRPKQVRPKYHGEETPDIAVSTYQSHQGPSDNSASERMKRKRSPSQARLEPENMEVQASTQGKKDETHRTRAKKHRHENEHDMGGRNLSVGSTAGNTDGIPTELSTRLQSLPGGGKDHGDSRTALATPNGAAIETQPETATGFNHDKARGQAIPNAVAETSEGAQGVNGDHETSETPQGPKKSRKKGRTDTGGSVAILRRKVMMNIIEKAGGAFPMGTELWYPFTTAWMKTKFREKPDMRTVRTSVKHLVDSGNLRQMTFSGRDSKGVMITKSIVTKPESAPDDPVVKNLQREMLAAGARFYFPPNTEISQEITKSSDIGASRRESRPITQLPVETGVTVQLQKKPALVLRKEKEIQRQLLQTLESEDRPEGRKPRVHRLKTLQRPPPAGNLSAIAKASGSGRTPIVSGLVGEGVWRRRAGKIKRIHAMLMNPKQAFHSMTGTFGTGTFHDLPQSLEGIFEQTRRRAADAAKAKGADRRTNQFFKDNDEISRWELQNEYLFSERSNDLRYINQTVPDSFAPAPIAGNIRFAIDEPAQPATPRVPMTTRRAAGRYKVPAAGPAERRLNKLDELATSAQKTTPRQPIRRVRTVHALPRSFVQRCIAALVAIRTLAGGTEGKMTDWPLVAKCFPGYDARFIQDRARNILSKNRLQIAKMQVDFQERFIEAYTNGHVPSIDYEDLEGYDWAGVVDWAQTQLDVPSSEKLPDLPATRAQFDSVFELRQEAPIMLDEVYQSIQSITVNRKRSLFAGTPFAEPLQKHAGSTAMSQRRTDLERLEVAKTWVRANVVTPEESYRPAEARRTLEHFGEHLMGEAVQSLVTDRVIKMGNRGRITPGRNYDITDHFINTLRRRTIESTQLRRAVQFKTTILDPELEENGVFEVDYHAEDGDMMALINLAAEQRIVLKPRDPPRDKYGLTGGGYLTRQIDKQKLRFAVDVYPVKDAYVFGNPIAEKISNLPRPTIAITGDVPHEKVPKIPIWLDIHGNFFKLLWDLVAGAVVGCVATRPGISASGIASMVKPAASAWEIKLLLEWMESVGVMRREHRESYQHDHEREPGWFVRGWWWMVLN